MAPHHHIILSNLAKSFEKLNADSFDTMYTEDSKDKKNIRTAVLEPQTDPQQLKPNTHPNITQPTRSTFPDPITLNIGGRTFLTSLSTLRSGSRRFAVQLSESSTWSAQPDGSYFIDTDPDLFDKLLRFMRRPEIFPLFYTQANGFDYDMYNRLEAEAAYFQIDALCNWIKQKIYLGAIVMQEVKVDLNQANIMAPTSLPVSVTQDWQYVPRVKDVYSCPRGIQAHRGDPKACGQKCQKVKHQECEFEQETHLGVALVKKRIDFNEKVCRLR